MANWRIWLIGTGVVAAAAIGGVAISTHAANGPGQSKSNTAAGALATDTSTIDPDAIDALNKMGAYLRTLKAVQVKAVVSTEEVQMDGQKSQQTSTIDLLAQRPNKLRAEVANDKAPRFFYYDGKTFTLFAPRPMFYAQAEAPATINDLADQLEDKFNIDLPLVDMFRWGTPESGVKDITSAIDLGPSSVDGTTCEHYMFRQPGLDWQLWIQSGEYPLPRKAVLTTTDDEARPQHESVWTWNLAPSFDEQAFAFTPPAGAHKISFKTVADARNATKSNAQSGSKAKGAK